VHGPVVTKAPSIQRIPADLVGSLREERIRLREPAEVGFLQRFVDERFRTADRRIAGAAYCSEELGRIGIASDIVATVSLGERAGVIERDCMNE
jgi:hypothetical protein